MRSMYFLGVFAVGTVTALAVGCGGDDSNGSGGAGGSGTTTTTTTTTTSTTTTTTTGSGADCDTFESACEFAVGTELTEQSLDPAAEDVDYYMFTGNAGDQLLVQITAKTKVQGTDPFDPTYLDTVVTLYDADQNQIAQNDDPTPRFSNDSQIFTVLPTTGTYYVRVAECNLLFPGQCADPTLITNTLYDLFIGGINPAILVNEDPAASTAIPAYSGDAANGFDPKLLQGGFSMDAEVDAYLFTVPAVAPELGDREASWFSFFPTGPDGNGSSTDIQRATVVDVTPGDPAENTIFAEANPSLGADLFGPLVPGHSYRIEIAHSTGAAGANPFYYIFNFPDAKSNPVEDETLNGQPNSNDTAGTAQALDQQDNGDGTFNYFIEGDVDVAGNDVDYFTMAVPAGVDQLNIACGGWRSGSGLRDLSFTLLNGGTMVTGGSATETEDTDAAAQQVVIPNGATTLTLRIDATTQEQTVTGKYYRCGAVFYNSTM